VRCGAVLCRLSVQGSVASGWLGAAFGGLTACVPVPVLALVTTSSAGLMHACTGEAMAGEEGAAQRPRTTQGRGLEIG
jgi:hypothetical protein